MPAAAIGASLAASLIPILIKSIADRQKAGGRPPDLQKTGMPDWFTEAINKMRENQYSAQDISQQQNLTRRSLKDTATKARKGITAQSYGGGVSQRRFGQMSTDAGLQVENAVADISNQMRSVNQQNLQSLMAPGQAVAQQQSGQAAAQNVDWYARQAYKQEQPTNLDMFGNMAQGGANVVGQYAVMQQQEESKAELMKLFEGLLKGNQQQTQGATPGAPAGAAGAGVGGGTDQLTYQALIEWLMEAGFIQRQPGQAFNVDPRTAVR